MFSTTVETVSWWKQALLAFNMDGVTFATICPLKSLKETLKEFKTENTE